MTKHETHLGAPVVGASSSKGKDIMMFEIKTPLLKLSSQLLLSAMQSSAGGGMKTIKFADSLTKFAGDQMKAKLSRKPIPPKTVDTLLLRWSELGLASQCEVVKVAESVGCVEQLAEAVGPLPPPGGQIAHTRPEPMF